MKRLKPKGKRGLVAVKRLGRNYKTGVFEQIVEKATKKYGSRKAGVRVASKAYWNKVRKRKHKK